MPQRIPLFVSEAKLKSFTSINWNVSPSDLVPYVLNAQDIYLQTYLGATFYNSMKNQVLNGNLSSANQYLMDNYIANALCNWALAMALPFLKFKIVNKSVLSPTSESADGISLEELKFLQQECRNTAESYTKRMVEWLCLHLEDYPLYANPDSEDGQLPDKQDPYFGGIVTPNSGYPKNWRWDQP